MAYKNKKMMDKAYAPAMGAKAGAKKPAGGMKKAAKGKKK